MAIEFFKRHFSASCNACVNLVQRDYLSEIKKSFSEVKTKNAKQEKNYGSGGDINMVFSTKRLQICTEKKHQGSRKNFVSPGKQHPQELKPKRKNISQQVGAILQQSKVLLSTSKKEMSHSLTHPHNSKPFHPICLQMVRF